MIESDDDEKNRCGQHQHHHRSTTNTTMSFQRRETRTNTKLSNQQFKQAPRLSPQSLLLLFHHQHNLIYNTHLSSSVLATLIISSKYFFSFSYGAVEFRHAPWITFTLPFMVLYAYSKQIQIRLTPHQRTPTLFMTRRKSKIEEKERERRERAREREGGEN